MRAPADTCQKAPRVCTFMRHAAQRMPSKHQPVLPLLFGKVGHLSMSLLASIRRCGRSLSWLCASGAPVMALLLSSVSSGMHGMPARLSMPPAEPAGTQTPACARINQNCSRLQQPVHRRRSWQRPPAPGDMWRGCRIPGTSAGSRYARAPAAGPAPARAHGTITCHQRGAHGVTLAR